MTSLPLLDIIPLVHNAGKTIYEKLTGIERAVTCFRCPEDDSLPVRVVHHARSSAIDWCQQQVQGSASASLPGQQYARLWSILSDLLNTEVGFFFVYISVAA
jgi:hypothetical protein